MNMDISPKRDGQLSREAREVNAYTLGGGGIYWRLMLYHTNKAFSDIIECRHTNRYNIQTRKWKMAI